MNGKNNPIIGVARGMSITKKLWNGFFSRYPDIFMGGVRKITPIEIS